VEGRRSPRCFLPFPCHRNFPLPSKLGVMSSHLLGDTLVLGLRVGGL
jgi:hypothetical protein